MHVALGSCFVEMAMESVVISCQEWFPIAVLRGEALLVVAKQSKKKIVVVALVAAQGQEWVPKVDVLIHCLSAVSKACHTLCYAAKAA